LYDIKMPYYVIKLAEMDLKYTGE